MGEPGLLERRSWRWLRTRIVGLLTVPPRRDLRGHALWLTRVQAAVMPPPQEPPD